METYALCSSCHRSNRISGALAGGRFFGTVVQALPDVRSDVRARFSMIRYLAALFLFTPGVTMAIEEPKFKILKEEGEYSLRQYEKTIVAEPRVEAEFEDAGGSAFRRLAGYIFGRNSDQSKIAMTAPVVMEKEGGGYKVQFTMPESWTLDRLPSPDEPSVKIRQLEPRFMAVIRYSGGWSQGRYFEHETLLKKWMEKNGIKPIGVPVFARYNSPWTLWFLRRNEVLCPVDVRAVSSKPETP